MIFNMKNTIQDIIDGINGGERLYLVNVKDEGGIYGYYILSQLDMETSVGMHFSEGVKRSCELEVTMTKEINLDEFLEKVKGIETKKLGEL